MFNKTDREFAIEKIELDVCDLPVMDYITQTHFSEFLEWAGDNYGDFTDVDGIDSKGMLEFWIAQEDEPSSRPRQYHAAA